MSSKKLLSFRVARRTNSGDWGVSVSEQASFSIFVFLLFPYFFWEFSLIYSKGRFSKLANKTLTWHLSISQQGRVNNSQTFTIKTRMML